MLKTPTLPGILLFLVFMSPSVLFALNAAKGQNCEILPSQIFEISLEHDSYVWAGDQLTVKMILEKQKDLALPANWTRSFLTLTAETSSNSTASISFEMLDIDLTKLDSEPFEQSVSFKIPGSAAGLYHIIGRFVAFLGESASSCVGVLPRKKVKDFQVRNAKIKVDQSPPHIELKELELRAIDGFIDILAIDQDSAICTSKWDRKNHCGVHQRVILASSDGRLVEARQVSVESKGGDLFRVNFVLPYDRSFLGPSAQVRLVTVGDQWGNIGELKLPEDLQ